MASGSRSSRERVALSAELTRRPVALVPVFTVALAAACWFASVRQMRGMDMGAETSLGSPASFIGLWMSMMAAMMLPAALPAILAFLQADSRFIAGLWFVASYLAVWLVFGVAAYGLYRQHGHAVAGGLTILAGLYELTPLKRACRERCRELARSGGRFGVYCVGSSAGLMLALFALGIMNLSLMVGVAAIVVAQKLLPTRPFLDATLALAIVVFGVLVVVVPSTFSL
jgi:predicted metal-binding membrane protein